MVVDSVIDAYGIALAFYIYDVIWDIFAKTGIAYFPFIALIFGAVKSASESSMEDFNTKSSLRTVLVGMVLMILALELALYPMVKLQFDDIKYYSRKCTNDETTPGTINTEILGEEAEFVAENMQVQLGGRDIYMPVLFNVAVRLSQAIKNWAVGDLPCSTDIRLVSDGMLSQRIEDEALRKETGEFIRWCYNPARRKYINKFDTSIPDEDNWPGSRELLMERGLYDNRDGDGFYSKIARPGFAESINVLPETESLPEGYGFPNCREWWLGPGVTNTPYMHEAGLSYRLYGQLEEWLRNKNEDIYDTLTTHLNRVKNRNYMFVAKKDVVVRESLFTPVKLSQLNSISTTDYGLQGDDGITDWTFRALGTVGVVAKSVEQMSGASMLQLAMPMVKPFVIMIIVISFLPAMIMGRYRWKYIGLFHGVVMSMMFWPFFWELSRLIDDTMLTAMGVDFDEINTQILTQWIASGLYLYAPLLFSTAMGWVGMAGADGAFQKMSGGAGSAGQKGVGETKKQGGKAKSAVKKRASGGAAK